MRKVISRSAAVAALTLGTAGVVVGAPGTALAHTCGVHESHGHAAAYAYYQAHYNSNNVHWHLWYIAGQGGGGYIEYNCGAA
jgi:hypothetical protein